MENDSKHTDEISVKETKNLQNESPHSGHRERLRQKFDYDPSMNIFADHEALEFHLSLVIPRKDTNILAHELLKQFGSLYAVLNATPCELFEIKNMTKSAAYLLASEFAMIRKAIKSSPKTNSTVANSPEQIIIQLSSQFIEQRNECTAVVFIDSNYKVIKNVFNRGTASGGIFFDISNILATATREGATFVLIAHNHPSGNIFPSRSDVQTTLRLHDALASVDKFLLDHVIYFNGNIYSFRNNGILDKFDDDYFHRMGIEVCNNPLYKIKFSL